MVRVFNLIQLVLNTTAGRGSDGASASPVALIGHGANTSSKHEVDLHHASDRSHSIVEGQDVLIQVSQLEIQDIIAKMKELESQVLLPLEQDARLGHVGETNYNCDVSRLLSSLGIKGTDGKPIRLESSASQVTTNCTINISEVIKATEDCDCELESVEIVVETSDTFPFAATNSMPMPQPESSHALVDGSAAPMRPVAPFVFETATEATTDDQTHNMQVDAPDAYPMAKEVATTACLHDCSGQDATGREAENKEESDRPMGHLGVKTGEQSTAEIRSGLSQTEGQALNYQLADIQPLVSTNQNWGTSSSLTASSLSFHSATLPATAVASTATATDTAYLERKPLSAGPTHPIAIDLDNHINTVPNRRTITITRTTTTTVYLTWASHVPMSLRVTSGNEWWRASGLETMTTNGQ